jgi:hypothetical protein
VIPATALIFGGLVAGCASTGASAPAVAGGVTASTSAPAGVTASAGAPPAYCASAARLKTSVLALSSVDILRGGLGAVQNEISTIQTNLGDFQTAAKSQFGPGVAALRTALTNLQTALSSAVSGNISASTLVSVVGDVSTVVESYTTLQTAVSARCG